MHAQRGADDVQIVIAGSARFGSSNVPTRTKIRCGRDSASLKSAVPHDGQNRRRMELPLSATLRYVPVSPVTANAAVGKQALTVPLPAPIYWHSLHQHTRVTIGGCALSQRTAPQRHRPVMVMDTPGNERESSVADPTLERKMAANAGGAPFQEAL